MKLIDALAIGSVVYMALFALAYLIDRRRAASPSEDDCCRAAMSDRRYHLHRVRVHGEGQA